MYAAQRDNTHGGGGVGGDPQKGLHLSGTSVVSITREKESNTYVFPKASLTLQEMNSGTERWQYNLSSPDGDKFSYQQESGQ